MQSKPKYYIGKRFQGIDTTSDFIEVIGVSPEKGYYSEVECLEGLGTDYFYFVGEHFGNKIVFDVVDEGFLTGCCKLIK